MKSILFIILALGFVSAEAGQVKVLKAKGRKAMVRFSNDMDVEKGDVFELADGDMGGSNTMPSIKFGGRDYKVAVDFLYASVDGGDSGVDSSQMSIGAGFGWVTGKYEYGPVIAISSGETESGGNKTETSTTNFGGFFEYNIIENKPGVQIVPFVQGSFLISSLELGGTKGDGFGIGFAGGLKYFFFQDSTAFVPMLNYTLTSLDFAGTDVDQTTLGITLSIQNYF